MTNGLPGSFIGRRSHSNRTWVSGPLYLRTSCWLELLRRFYLRLPQVTVGSGHVGRSQAMICSSFGTATAMLTVAWKGIEVIATLVVVLICVERLDVANAGPRCTSPGRVDRGLLSPQDISDVTNVFKSLINAENAKDPVMVDRLIWNSPSTLLVDKLEKVSQGQWPGLSPGAMKRWKSPAAAWGDCGRFPD